jgi:hypothetical protein
MPERRDANLFEVSIGQITQDSEINIVFGKPPNVLLHTNLFEPVRNLLHRGSTKMQLQQGFGIGGMGINGHSAKQQF